MAAVSLSATVPMLLLLVAVTLWLQDQQGLQREASLQRQALRAADAVDSMLSAQVARLTAIAAGVAAREQRLDILHRVLRAVADTEPGIGSISLIDGQGQRLLDSRFPWGSTLPNSGTPELDRRVLQDGVGEWSPLVKGSLSGRLVVGLGVPVLDVATRPVGVLRLVLLPESIDRKLQRLAVPPGWVVTVLDQRSVIVARNQLPEQYRGQRASDSIVAQLSQPLGTVQRGESRDGRAVMAVVAPVGSSGWHVVVGAPEAEIDRAERETLGWVVLAGLSVAAVSIAATLWTGRLIARQVQHAAEGQAPLGRGIRELQHLGRRMDDAERALVDARHDTLTGLPGRALFLERARALLAAGAAGAGFGLLYFDLDGFKALNDARGHDAGDLALVHVGAVLGSVLRPADLAARLGGDEFVVLLSGGTDAEPETYPRVAERVKAGIAGFGHGLGCSIGVVLVRSGESIAEALTRADQAMLTAKRAGKGRIVQA